MSAIPTVVVRRKSDGQEVRINCRDFDADIYDPPTWLPAAWDFYPLHPNAHPSTVWKALLAHSPDILERITSSPENRKYQDFSYSDRHGNDRKIYIATAADVTLLRELYPDDDDIRSPNWGLIQRDLAESGIRTGSDDSAPVILGLLKSAIQRRGDSRTNSSSEVEGPKNEDKSGVKPNRGGRPRTAKKSPRIAAFNYKIAAKYLRERADRQITMKDFGRNNQDIDGKFLGEKGLRRILRWVERNPSKKPYPRP